MTDAPRLVSTAEAARAVGFSSETLTRWARAGRVTPAISTPGTSRVTYRWDLDELRRQLSGQREQE